MLSERALTAVMRVLTKGYATHEPTGIETLPDPVPGRRYVLYAHVPFCERLCTYCSFNRFLFKEELARPYYRRLRDEMRMVADLGYDFGSLYVGGGTPTVLLDELCETIDLARSLFSLREVSSETSPNHLGPAVAEKLGGRVQRMSVGVQSFDDRLLKIMDRYDKYGSAMALTQSIKGARGYFDALNVDMIFNFPSQTESMLMHDVEALEETGCTQATFYPLMAGPNAARELAETVGRIDHVRESEYYFLLDDRMRVSFKPASAWSYTKDKSGMIDEYIVDYDEYVGIGSGALSFLEGRVYCNTFSISEYAERIDARRLSVNSAGKPYDRKALMRYRLASDLFGLSLDKRRFQATFGQTIDRGLPVEMAFLRANRAFDRDDEEMLTLTTRGRYLLVVMMREILSNSNELRDEARAALPVEERMMLLEGTSFAPASEPECASA